MNTDAYAEPLMHQIRPGLELCYKTEPIYSAGYTPLVVSHRRAGTHLLGEFINRHWSRDWLKSHDFPERLPVLEHPTFYVVRNPFDVIYATYNWWNEWGGAHNEEVASAVAGINFHEYLHGAFGEVIGYQSWKVGIRDNFHVTRGMEYDPIRYWRDHFRAAKEAGLKIISYEELVQAPRRAAERVAQVIGDLEDFSDIPTIMPPVGMSPNIKKIGHSFRFWPEWAVKKVEKLLSPDLLAITGFASLEDWLYGKVK